MSNGKDIIIILIAGLIKKILQMSKYFSPYRGHIPNVNVTLDLSNYATKKYLSDTTHVKTSDFALKINLASQKAEVNKLDFDKLVPVRNDLSKLQEYQYPKYKKILLK